ncbi:MAG TPA: hypothetical protein VFA50_10260 [Stellaceae bacterium]|nr:hypothetical protein [Stellaceae bacterium]
MAGLVVAELDFSAGLRCKNITVPAMPAVVEFKDPPKELVEAARKDKLVIQSVATAAYEQLKKSQQTVQAAIKDFDAKFKMPSDLAKGRDAVKTFANTCAQICKAQEGLAVAAAKRAWDGYVAKNKAWTKYKVIFACKVTAASISLAASVAAAVVTGGTTVVAVIGMAKTVAGMASDAYDFAKGIEKLEEGIRDEAVTLAKRFADPKVNWKATAKEIAAALGAPLVAGTTKMDQQLKDHVAKSGSLQKDAEKMWSDAKGIIEKLRQIEGDDKRKQIVALLGNECTKLLDAIGTLNQKLRAADDFHATYTKTLAEMRALRSSKIDTGKRIVDIGGTGATVFGIAKNVLTVASKLA